MHSETRGARVTALTTRNSFVRAVSPLLGPVPARHLYTVFNRVGRLPYRESSSPGFLLLENADGTPSPRVRLDSPVPLDDLRCLRKLLHVSSPALPVLSDGRLAHGWGGRAACGHSLTVRFDWPGTWALLRAGRIVVRVRGRVAPDGGAALREDRFASILRQIFGPLPSTAVARLWKLACSAARQARGTNVLISAGAASEASRLASQCLPVRPFALTPAVMGRITGIDGTVVMDVDGVCHAVGAILDGPVSARGD